MVDNSSNPAFVVSLKSRLTIFFTSANILYFKKSSNSLAIRLERVNSWYCAKQFLLGIHRISGTSRSIGREIWSQDFSTDITFGVCSPYSADSNGSQLGLEISLRCQNYSRNVARIYISKCSHNVGPLGASVGAWIPVDLHLFRFTVGNSYYAGRKWSDCGINSGLARYFLCFWRIDFDVGDSMGIFGM